MTEIFLSMVTRGVYCLRDLPDDEFIFELNDALFIPTVDKIRVIKNRLLKLYGQDIASFAKKNIINLVKGSLKENTNITATISEYFTQVSNNTLSEIVSELKVGQLV